MDRHAELELEDIADLGAWIDRTTELYWTTRDGILWVVVKVKSLVDVLTWLLIGCVLS